MKRFVIIGLGNFGKSVAEVLYAHGHEVVGVDQDPQAVDAVARFVTRAAVGDGRQRAVLDRVGADGADAGIVSTGDDIAASVLATLALRDLGVPRVYCKVISDDHRRVMARVGADEAIFPERQSGIALAQRLLSGDVFNYFSLGDGYSVQEMRVPPLWEGRSLREIGLRPNFNLVAVALHDVVNDHLRVPPDPEERLQGSSTLLLAGRNDDLARVGALATLDG
jgi:trk system potassium uptake protein